MTAPSIRSLVTLRRLSVILLGLLLSACAVIRHDDRPLALRDPSQIRVARDIQLPAGDWPSDHWWDAYRDPQLNTLIVRALEQSPTMRIAQERILQAQANAESVRADTSLQVSALASIQRERVSRDSFLGAYAGQDPQIDATGPWYTAGIVGLGAGYQIDIWGKQKAEVAAAIGIRNARTMERADAELEVSAGVAQLYYEMQATYQLIDLLSQLREIDAFSVRADEARAHTGVVPQTQIDVARANLLEVQRRLIAAQAHSVQLREAMRALIGAGPDDLEKIRPVGFPEIPSALPQILSYELLARRPDLQAMRWYVQSSLDTVDAAKAAFYPNFDIKAFFGVDALHLGNLLMHSSQQIALVPGLSLPVFDSGRLNSNLAAARSLSDELILKYNQAILDAVRDVATTASQLQDLDAELRLQNDRVAASTAVWRNVDAHYQRGLASRIDSLEARQNVIAQQIELLDVSTQRTLDDINLTKELGGGYQTNHDANPVPR